MTFRKQNPAIGDVHIRLGSISKEDNEWVFLGDVKFTFEIYSHISVNYDSTTHRTSNPIQAWGNLGEIYKMVSLESFDEKNLIEYRNKNEASNISSVPWRYNQDSMKHVDIEYSEALFKAKPPMFTQLEGIDFGTECAYRPVGFEIVRE